MMAEAPQAPEAPEGLIGIEILAVAMELLCFFFFGTDVKWALVWLQQKYTSLMQSLISPRFNYSFYSHAILSRLCLLVILSNVYS